MMWKVYEKYGLLFKAAFAATVVVLLKWARI
jgi:hypothetical protein